MKRILAVIAFAGVVLSVAMMLAPKSSAQNNQLQSQTQERPLRPVHTFCIVGRDAETGEIGVAVQSHWLSVGSVVPWAEAGVGAVAAGVFGDASFGKRGRDLIRIGKGEPDHWRSRCAGVDARAG